MQKSINMADNIDMIENINNLFINKKFFNLIQFHSE